MSLPSPNLDDLRFQEDLVDEARKRIIQYCPEWTDYNLSDPGITLIELFAWMSELILYRLNRVPEKNYVKFLELLGMQLRPASSAGVDLTFWLSAPIPFDPEEEMDVVLPKGLEVIAEGPDEEEIVFSTNRDLTITIPKLIQVLRDSEVHRNYLPRLGIETFFPFDEKQPKQGDTFYLGFDPHKDIAGHILQLTFSCEETEAVGIRREDPPWVWECLVAEGQWQEVPLSSFREERDTTGGLNNPDGSLVLYLPLDARSAVVHGRHGYWVRCRLEQRHASQGMYAESPRVLNIEAHTLGASVPSAHAQIVEQESLGMSDGDPGQEFTLENVPVLDLQDDESLLVEEFRKGEIVKVPWECVPDFSKSTQYDRHFTLDAANGKVRLGPSVRQPDGTVKQYGRIPEMGRGIYFSRYRYGGGSKGNLPPNTLQSMSSSVAYVSRVTNLQRATGGRDQETLDEVKMRAQREFRAQKRAVTAQDYEQLMMNFSRAIARVKCITPGRARDGKDIGLVTVLVVPAAEEALQERNLSRLHLSEQFVETALAYLDQYRLLTTHVLVSEPEYIGVKVGAKIEVEDFSDPEQVRTRVDHYLRNFLNPLVVFPEQFEQDPLRDDRWVGWPFGKDLYVAELYALIQRVPGVKYVLDLEVFTRPVEPRLERMTRDPDEQPLTRMDDKVLKLSPRTLVCSLEHSVAVLSQNAGGQE